MTAVDTELAPPVTDEGETKTHIVNPPDNGHITQGRNMTAGEVVAHARAEGREVQALCGHWWVPSKDPDKYPVCETCIKIAGIYMREAGE